MLNKYIIINKHYGIIYHAHHPCLLLGYINITMQITNTKGTT